VVSFDAGQVPRTCLVLPERCVASSSAKSTLFLNKSASLRAFHPVGLSHLNSVTFRIVMVLLSAGPSKDDQPGNTTGGCYQVALRPATGRTGEVGQS